MIFLLLFVVTNISSQQLTLYDNSDQAAVVTIVTNEPCLIETTEHFSLKDGIIIPGKLSLQSTRLVKKKWNI